ncbi:MAG TPA: hypothetical protein VNY04_02140 [Chthoniobacterales bacterium]|nr:hypothetical protein [Chthoniobacterales bacterium]
MAATTSGWAQSQVWTYSQGFIYDPWNRPILDYLATIPQGKAIAPENLRAQIKQALVAQLRVQAAGDRVTKRQIIQQRQSAADVASARELLIRENHDVQVAVFQAAASYFDTLGLLGIMQVVGTWQCGANEQCPIKVVERLDTLLAMGGKFMKTEVFRDVGGKPWIFSTGTYEVLVGQELRVVPLRSRKLLVQEMS